MAWIPLRARVWRAVWSLFGGWVAKRPLEPSALAKWSAFYSEEEEAGAPRALEDYAMAILSLGLPDVGNPFPQGEEMHYRVHPGGFLSGEIEKAIRPPEGEEEEARATAAMARIGLLLHLECPMRSARAYWAEEDLKFACAVSLAEGGWEMAGAKAPNAVMFAMEEKLIDPLLVPGLLIARKLIEEAKYPPPWRRSNRGGVNHDAPERNGPEEEAPPVPLNMEKWRSAREAVATIAPEEEKASLGDVDDR